MLPLAMPMLDLLVFTPLKSEADLPLVKIEGWPRQLNALFILSF